MNIRLKRIISVFFSVVLILSSMSIFASAIKIDTSFFGSGTRIAEKADFNIVPGVTESYIVTQNSDGTNQIKSYVLEVDLSNPTVGIITSYKDYMNNLSDTPEWGMQAVRDQAVAVENYYRNEQKQAGFEVVAGVNGDFFNMGNGAPTGTLVMNGKVYNVNEGWPYFAILKDGTPVIREGGSDVSDVAQSVGGPAIILRDGVIDASSGYGQPTHPRTAVGIKADGSVVFVVSDGRQPPISNGQTFQQLAEEMLALGCVDAISLDGGGSATFVSQREGETSLSLRSSPADGIERTVSTAVMIYSNTFNNKNNLTNKWYEYDGNICYFGADGIPVTGEQKIGEYTYTFDEYGKLKSYALVKADGTLATNQWVGSQYYVGADGMPVTGTQKIGKYTYTFGDDGKLIKGALVKEGNYTYYYIAGQKQRNWHFIDGYWYYFDRQTGFGMATKENSDKGSIDVSKDGMYTVATTDAILLFTFDSKGRLTRGAWLETGNGKVYYWGNYERVMGWQYIDDSVYYFNDDTYAVTGNQIIDGVEYTFDADGKLQAKETNVNVSGTYYYFDSEGKIVKAHVTDHAYAKTVDEAVASEHGKAGLTEGEHCGKCGFVLKAQTPLPIKNHEYSQTVVAPTCTEIGYTEYTCSCGDSYRENYVDETGHTAGEWTAVSETLEQRICTVCNRAVEEREIIAGLAGDANGDGKVNAADARLVLRMASKIDPVAEELVALLDMTGDGIINAADARIILRKSAKLE